MTTNGETPGPPEKASVPYQAVPVPVRDSAAPARAAGAGRITEIYAVGLLARMLEIPSPSYNETALGRELVRSMRELGFTAYVDGTGNAVGEITRGAGPTVMLLGHMDTIPETMPTRSADGKLYGRGAVDAKGPLAAMICAAAAAVDFRGKIVVIGAVEEETPGSRGAMAIRRTYPVPNALIIGEPSGWSNVVLGYKGKLDLRLRVDCPSTHPSNPAPKATERVAAAWAALLELLGPQASHASFDQPAATLVSFTGDIVSAEMDVSVRTPVGFDVPGLLAALDEAWAGGEVTVLNTVAACRTGRADPVVRALSAGIRAQEGRPTAKLKTATSDMNTLAEVWDLPMGTYGPGDSTLDHSDDEHILITDYIRGIAVLTAALTELGGLDPAALQGKLR
ncbi:M20/M25/M40 family metallo-hydrolase [Kitasatospora sp. NPDC057223]|uniref:M20/M25/M40 family metallo-hydrolase n=1 Tax=Kitasatospora sp. NPDC057223 TaxID=3346055 RepID=UPI00363C8B87